MNNIKEDFILRLNKKDVICLFILLKQSDCSFFDSNARILKKIEEYLFTFLTIDQFEHIEDYYTDNYT